ncbi:MAG: MBL fold metallo-hydrolase [Candidatus Marinimicrobia bacterium]|nr:MBL fold metallo-hydrolase [Candidatus Neomarinimicrobiota bacterium]
MRIRILGSGSKGNSCLIQTDRALFLLDNGFSGKEITRRLESLEINPKHINGIIISHDHRDHVGGAGIFARRFHTPIYINHLTYQRSHKALAKTEVRFFETGGTIEYKDLLVDTFPLPHDAADPVGFLFQRKNGNPNSKSIGYVTDIGQVTDLVRQKLTSISALIVEANHDETMLLNGPYPYKTKQRVRGRYGHLSNRHSGQLVSELIELTGIDEVTIAHLSENNNDPLLAKETVLQTVEERLNRSIQVHVASQSKPMEHEIIIPKESIE